MNPHGGTANGHPPEPRQLVTLIAPAFNEAENAPGLVGFFRTIRAAHPDLDFELIVVDDGSTDGTSKAVLDALDGPGDLARMVSLSRNFGSHAAITAGFALSRGDCALTLSADLQEPLEAIGHFLDEWRAGHDVVWGVRETRAVPRGFANLLSRRFSSVFQRMSSIPTYPEDGPSQILVSRRVIDAVNQLPETNRNVFGIVAWVGFSQTTIRFAQLPRPAGRSKWTTKKKIRLVVDSFVEFSSAPFLIAFLAGLTIGLLGLAGVVATLVVALVTLAAPGTLALILSVVFLLGGLNLAALGGFGEYLWRAGDDARRRPVYVLRGVQDVGAGVSTEDARPGAASRVR